MQAVARGPRKSTSDAELLARVAALEQQVAVLQAALTALPAAGAGMDLGEQLIGALAAEYMVGLNFTSAELIAHAERVPSAYLLRATLKALEADTPGRLGKVLQRLSGRPIGGRVVERVTREASGTIWALQRASYGAQ